MDLDNQDEPFLFCWPLRRKLMDEMIVKVRDVSFGVRTESAKIRLRILAGSGAAFGVEASVKELERLQKLMSKAISAAKKASKEIADG